MASVDTENEFEAARALGWRTFRVRLTSALMPGEIVCPASQEGGHKTTCIDCRICSGHAGANNRKSVAIYSHGQGTVRFFKSAQSAFLESLNW